MQKRQPQQHTIGTRGFTLLETLVAIFILVISITGPMVFAQSGLRASFLARDQVTAFYLAQDVIETIKNIRDENGLNGRDWLTSICDESLANNNGVCVIYLDTTLENPEASRCDGGLCPPLYVDEFKRYVHTGTPEEKSRFTRTVSVYETNDNIEAQIVVEVGWTSNVRIDESRIVVQENIFNWIPDVN
ncbi:MAG: hypothetical protein RL150_471 [Candidatus Parcubacteria bacterium]|jgi:prepilin-type N-terminal cleavage/methylation domain-containing protein